MSTKTQKFFFEHKIFSFEQFAVAMANPVPTCRIMLHKHLKTGNVVRIKQGLYASIPPGANPENYPIDPYAIISCLAEDTLIALHMALEFYGYAYTVYFQHIFQSTKQIKAFQFRQDYFKVTQYPKSLPAAKRLFLVDEIDHHGFIIRVTHIERTIVDVLDRINLSGGLEEVWRSLNNIQSIRAEDAVHYAILLNNATTIAKIGFYLRLRQKDFQISEHYFDQLKKHLPRSVHYLDRNNRKNGKYIKEWRLVVPNELVKQHWEDVFDMSDL